MKDKMNEKIKKIWSLNSIEWVLFCAAISFNLIQLFWSWNQPILGDYAFRQTQTAISSYWIAKGGPWFAYPTPVLGAPWSIPFEFPLYQWLVAGLSALFPSVFTLDQAGRLVSEIFFLGCLWPAWRIATRFENGRSIFLVCSTLVLLSPLYVFWSRSFMMESAALFFSMWFVASIGDFIDRPSTYGWTEMAVTASLAASIKITTFVGFSFAGAILVLSSFLSMKRVSLRHRHLLRYALVGCSVAISLLVLLVWLRYSDSLKSQNIFGADFLASSPGMATWNFGTLAQRESLHIWHVAWVRAPNEALGSWIVAILIGVYVATRLSRRQMAVIVSLITLYLSVFFVFTNLHLIHHYYQYANSIFLVAATGYVLYAGLQRDKPIALALLLVVCAFEIFGFYTRFYNNMVQPNRQLQTLLSTFIREKVPGNEMFVTVGLSWSSEVPYYAERRALMIPDTATPKALTAISNNIDAVTSGLKIGAIVVCPNAFQEGSPATPAYSRLMAQLTLNRHTYVVGYCEVHI